MRTNIEIDDKLMSQAMKSGAVTTKKAVVEEALKMYVRLNRQARALSSLKGLAKDDLGWDPPPAKWADSKSREDERAKPIRKKAA